MKPSTAFTAGLTAICVGVVLVGVSDDSPGLLLGGLASICVGAGALIAGIASWRDGR